MPFNPGQQYVGGQLLAQGLQQFGAGIGSGIQARQEKLDALKKRNAAAKGLRTAFQNLGLLEKEELEDMSFEALTAFGSQASNMIGMPMQQAQTKGQELANVRSERANSQSESADVVAAQLGASAGDPETQQKIINDSAGTVGADNYFSMLDFVNNSGLKTDIMKAQLDQTLAATQKYAFDLEQSMAQSTMELPKENRDDALKLGAELRASKPVKDFLSGKGALESLKNNLRQGASDAGRTPADDMALVFQFMKTLDPGSTVREGEFKLAETAGSAVTQFKNSWDKIFTGTRLQPEQVEAVVTAAENAIDGLASAANQTREMIAGQGTAVGLDPKFFAGGEFSAFPSFSTVEEAEAAGLPPGTKIKVGGRSAIVE